MSAVSSAQPALRIAVIGAGTWGPTLARGFATGIDWDLVAICDVDVDRAETVARISGRPAVVTSVDELLTRHDVDAVAIATPTSTHHAIALQAIAAGKHVLVERPLAGTMADGQQMVAAADRAGTVLIAAHTYCYTPAVLKIREILESGRLGEIRYVDSVRIDLGLAPPATDVFWDLAPHDLSVLDFVLPGGLQPTSVSARGADPLRSGRSCVGYLVLPLTSGASAHIHVNWLSPTKIRRMVIGGSKKTLVWDDLNPHQRLSIFDRGVEPGSSDQVLQGPAATLDAMVSQGQADVWSPALPEAEPLGRMVSAFAESIRSSQPAPTDGDSALRVLSVLEATEESLAHGSVAVPVGGAAATPTIPGLAPSLVERR